ncbi:MAG: hypothetical protein RIF32_07215 [Leptospirales bacterium]|jgi:hypothetical protein
MNQHRYKTYWLKVAVVFAILHPIAGPLSVSSGVLHARDRSPGRPYFEQAYAAEKETPADAIELYKRAIAAGLKPELVRAARWRLFYLYRKAGDYGEALSTAGHLGSDKKLKNVLGDLYKEIAVIYKVSDASAREFALGLKQLARNHDAESTAHFERALRGNVENEAFRLAITNHLMRRGQSGAALALLKKIGYDPGGDKGPADGAALARADLLVKLKRDDEARQVLMELARSPRASSLESADRSRLFYLLARVDRRAKDRAAAVRWFRLAAAQARSADEEDLQSRMQGLAAYELYRGGRKLQARSLLYGSPNTADANVNLLEVVLRADVDREAAALKKLRLMIPQLKSGRQSFLSREALRLAGESTRVSETEPTKKQPRNGVRNEAKNNSPGTDASPKPPPESGQDPAKQAEAFWQHDFRKTFGTTVKVEVPENHRLFLARNPDRLQFHGYSRSRDRLAPRLHGPLAIPGTLKDLGQLLEGLRGDFVLMIAPPAEEGDDSSDSTNTEGGGESRRVESLPKRARLASLNESRSFSSQAWLMLNIHCDGTGSISIELEEDVARSRMPGYARGLVQNIEIIFAE